MNSKYCGDLAIIGTRGSEEFLKSVDWYLHQWRTSPEDKEDTYLVSAECPRFGSGEGKGVIHQTMRGTDVYIFADVFNYGQKYKMYGQMVPMSPDDHFQDLKRLLCAVSGKSERISVIMPMLYEGRQHRRTSRESLDCAMALQELTNMGVSNIITFDAHDPRVQNAIPEAGFDSVRSSYQMLKALTRVYPDIKLDPNEIAICSPDEGGMSRAMYYSAILGCELGMFYKRRDYSVIVDGKNPIVAHEFLGKSVEGKDVIIVDDMISSGDSVIDIAEKLKKQGARRIFAFATFGLFCNGTKVFDDAYAKGYIDKVFTTNLNYRSEEIINSPWYAEVNMCKYVAYIIDTLNKEQSMVKLLNPVDRIQRLLDRVRGTQESQNQ